MCRDSAIRVDVLARPGFLLAVGLLALNDRVLKAWMPGLVTGKLSDFAGVFALAVLIGVVARSRSVGVAATAIGFVVLKAIPGAAVLAAPVLGGVTRTDPSDLIALVVLVPAWWWLGRGLEDRSADVRTMLGMFCAAAGVLVMTATSCGAPPQLAHLVRLHDGSVMAEIRNGFGTGRHFARSVDGRLWTRVPRPAVGFGPGRDAVCLATGECFRVVVDSRVESKIGQGRWTVDFQFSAEQNRRRNLRVQECVGTVPFFGSVAVAGTGPSERVVVAVGSDGVLWRSPDGRWERHSVRDVRPARLDGPSSMSGLVTWAVLGGLAVPFVLLLVGRVRSGRWPRFPRIGIVGWLALLPVLGFFDFFGLDYTILGPMALGGVVVMLALAWIVDRVLPDRKRRRRRGMVLSMPLGSPVPAVEGVRPAWLPDPSQSDRLRWWDGTEWSGWTAPKR